MNKHLIVIGMTLVLLAVGLLISVNNVKADEEGWHFNWFSFGYSGWTEDTIDLDIYINCSFPDDRPHLYEPYPDWEPGYYETTERYYLKTPYLDDNITGKFWGGDILFSLDRNHPSPGEYKLYITDEHVNLLFTHDFNMSYDFIVNVSDLNWLYDCSGTSGNQPSTYAFGNSIDEKKVGSICGFKLSFTIENIGDIPYFTGIPTNENILIDYRFNLYKNGSDISIFSSEIIPMCRSDAKYSGEGWGGKIYISTGEKFDYVVHIFFDDSTNLNEYGSGNYFIDGYIFINPENLSYKINSNSNTILTVETSRGTPGFELVLTFLAIAMVSLILLRGKRGNE